MKDTIRKILEGDEAEVQRFREYLLSLPEGQKMLEDAQRRHPKPLTPMEPPVVPAEEQAQTQNPVRHRAIRR